MKPEHHLFFPPFHLDLVNETLWCGARLVPLRPKALAVLRYLAEHAQRLVTREELLKAVWQRPYVSEGLLRGSAAAFAVAKRRQAVGWSALLGLLM